MFVHLSPRGHNTLLLYVNDIIIIGNDPVDIQSIKSSFQQQFEIKDQDHLLYFMAIEDDKGSHGYMLSGRNKSLIQQISNLSSLHFSSSSR